MIKKEKTIEEEYKVLDQISHILLRPNTYVGSNKPHTSTKWIIEDGKMIQKEITYIPSFLKIFDEVITNCVDESKREGSKLNTIKVNITTEEITIWDNGGIKVLIHKDHNLYLPEVIIGNLLSGSNYDDTENRTWAGTNGLGVKLTNIFSKNFSISTCDGKNRFYQVYSNNMRSRTEPLIEKSKKNHTEIRFEPDFDRFGIECIDMDHFKMIEKRVFDIAACNTHLKVYFNDNLLNLDSFEDYIRLYTDNFFYESSKDKSWSIGISLSENGFQQISFVNTTETYDGGTHIDYVTNQLISKLREFFMKKHKVDVKPSELKNHMMIFLNSTVINPSFSSQTKEKLITEIKDFGYQFEISNKIVQLVLKSDIVLSILDWIEQKKNAEENKMARELNKNLSKVRVEKLIDAKGKDRINCSIGLFEGDSASNAARKYRDPETQGFFSLRGKFINAFDIPTKKLIENSEVVNVMAAIGLKLGQKAIKEDLRYGKILLYVDADCDGSSICALLINFFYRYWPELFEYEMIYKVETPLLVCHNLKNKKKLSFYSEKEYSDWYKTCNPKDWDIKYKKGLAALFDDEYKEIILNPVLLKIDADDKSSEYLNIWFGKDPELRKDQLI